MSTFDNHIKSAETSLRYYKDTYNVHPDLLRAVESLLAAVKELDRRQGVTRFPVGE